MTGYALTVPSTPELYDLAPVALRWTAGGSGRIISHGFAFFFEFLSPFAAGFGLAVKGLRHRGRTADLAHRQDLHFKVAALGPDLQHVAGLHLARGLGRLMMEFDAAQLAGTRRQGPALEEPRRPQPLVDPDAGHPSILRALPKKATLTANKKGRPQRMEDYAEARFCLIRHTSLK